MHAYLLHLLADIAAAHRNERDIEQARPISFEDKMAEIERWVEGAEREHTFGYYCGLQSGNFPPAHQLTVAEMHQVMEAFTKMMFSWNVGIDLPVLLPVDIGYSMTVDTLNSDVSIVNSGFMHFDFCTGYAPDCAFKQYCPCLKIWNDDDYNVDLTALPDTDTPF